jgi:hypothetical protein
MFSLLALLAVVLVGAAFFAVAGVALMTLKFAFKVVLLPLKLLFLPFAALFVIVKFALIFALGAALIGVIVAIIVPLVVVAAVIAVPIALSGAFV